MAIAGRYLTFSTAGEKVRAFIPSPLASIQLPVLDRADQDLLEKANRALGKLDSITEFLPDADLFIYFYVRKEALVSSQIEGTQSSFSDLLRYENHFVPGIPLEDVREVSSYVAAMNHGLKRLRKDEFPLCLRLIREVHGILLSKGRGSRRAPGEFRRSQNWIGGTRPGAAQFVPPPPDHVTACMGELESFLQDRMVRTPALVKAALAHVQFETIHPFLDGNGRVGRLLITLILCSEGVLREPLLFLSLYFKRNRREYYDWLQRVRLEGDWTGWIRFFLRGVVETAGHAADTVRAIRRQLEKDRLAIDRTSGRAVESVRRLHDMLKKKPMLSVPGASQALRLAAPTVRSAVKHLESLGILSEVTGKQRDRIYLYEPYTKLLDEGTEPLR